MIGRQARQMALVHSAISCLDMARKALRVEQRRRKPVALELMFDGLQSRGIPRKFDRQRFIGLRRGRDQLRQADRLQQAAGDAARERVSRLRQDRQPRPESVARRRVGVKGKRVEEQIREAVPREMFGRRRPGRKDDPGRVDASLRRFRPQIRSETRGAQLKRADTAASASPAKVRCPIIMAGMATRNGYGAYKGAPAAS